MSGQSLQTDDATWKNWKRVAPCLYDFMANHHLVWPALACRYGPRQAAEGLKYTQIVYVSEQTNPAAKTPNKLVAHVVSVPEPNCAPIDHITGWKENQKSPYVGKPEKTIHHPGECNKIREIPGHDNIIATHSDVPEVYIWDLNTQPDVSTLKKAEKNRLNAPDLKLTGHTKDAQFALATSSYSPSVLSGGEDTNVLMWNLNDGNHLSLIESGGVEGRGGNLAARTFLRGHTNVVTDVCFEPGSDQLVASTADDHVIMTWDVRQARPTNSIGNAHGDDNDILCVDWSAHRSMLATGGNRGDLRIWDLRRVTNSDGSAAPLHILMASLPEDPESTGILVAEWSPTHWGWVASGGDDGRVSIWDVARTQAANESDGLPSQLMLQHLGHLGNIMDMQWSPTDPFTLISASNDGGTYKDGGALQMWRMSSFITDDLDAVKTDLECYGDWLVSGKIGDLKRKEQPAQIDAPLPGDASADATVEVPVPQSAAEADAEAPMAEDAAVASAPEGEGMDDDAGGAQEAGSEVAGASVDANGGIAPADEQVSGMDE